ncbi:unnamed protein product [Amoebophrya sp. A120]|nr:unnamed protein product [Amoebophrya sp. A120]|eukprot:GSA120T00016447001.1
MAASYRSLQKILEHTGWACDRITGSHHIFTKDGHGCIPVSIHSKHAVSRAVFMGTLKCIEERHAEFEQRRTREVDTASINRGRNYAGKKPPAPEVLTNNRKTSTLSARNEDSCTSSSASSPPQSPGSSSGAASTAAPSPEDDSPPSTTSKVDVKNHGRSCSWTLPVILVEELAGEPALLAELTAEAEKLTAAQKDHAEGAVEAVLEEVFVLLSQEAFEQAERKLKMFFYEHKLFSPGKVLKEMKNREPPGLIPDQDYAFCGHDAVAVADEGEGKINKVKDVDVDGLAVALAGLGLEPAQGAGDVDQRAGIKTTSATASATASSTTSTCTEQTTTKEYSKKNLTDLLSSETLEELDFVLLATIRARVFRVIDTGFVSFVETDGLWQILALIDDMHAKFWRKSALVSDKREDMLRNLATRFNARLATEVEKVSCADDYDGDGTKKEERLREKGNKWYNRKRKEQQADDTNSVVHDQHEGQNLEKQYGNVILFYASVTEAFDFIAATVEKGYLKRHYVVEHFGHAFALSVAFLLEDLRKRFFHYRQFAEIETILQRLLKVFGVPTSEISPKCWYQLTAPGTSDNEVGIVPGTLELSANASAMRKLFLTGLADDVRLQEQKDQKQKTTRGTKNSSCLASAEAKRILSRQVRERQLADQKQLNKDYILYTPEHAAVNLGLNIADDGELLNLKIFFHLTLQGLKDQDRQAEVELTSPKAVKKKKQLLFGLYNILCGACEHTCRSADPETLALFGGWFSSAQIRRQLEQEWGMDPLEGAPEKLKAEEMEDDDGEASDVEDDENVGQKEDEKNAKSGKKTAKVKDEDGVFTSADLRRYFAEMADDADEREEINAAKEQDQDYKIDVKQVDGYVKLGDELKGSRRGGSSERSGQAQQEQCRSCTGGSVLDVATTIRATDPATAVAMLQQVELFSACATYLIWLAPIYQQMGKYGLVPFNHGQQAFFSKKKATSRNKIDTAVVSSASACSQHLPDVEHAQFDIVPGNNKTKDKKEFIFCVGDRVNLKNLKSKPELNGQRAEVVECISAQQGHQTRYAVRLLHENIRQTSPDHENYPKNNNSSKKVLLSLKPDSLALVRADYGSLLQNREAGEQIGFVAPRIPTAFTEREEKFLPKGSKERQAAFRTQYEQQSDVFRGVPDYELDQVPEVPHDKALRDLMTEYFAKTEDFAKLVFGQDGRSTSSLPEVRAEQRHGLGRQRNEDLQQLQGVVEDYEEDQDILFPAAKTRDNGELDVDLDPVAALMLGILAQDVLQGMADILLMLHHEWSGTICPHPVCQQVFQLLEKHGAHASEHEVFGKYWTEPAWRDFHLNTMTDLQQWSSNLVQVLLNFQLAFELETENENRANIAWAFLGSVRTNTRNNSSTSRETSCTSTAAKSKAKSSSCLTSGPTGADEAAAASVSASRTTEQEEQQHGVDHGAVVVDHYVVDQEQEDKNDSASSSTQLEALVSLVYRGEPAYARQQREQSQRELGITAPGSNNVCKYAQDYRAIRWVYLPALMERIGILRHRTGPKEVPTKMVALLGLCNEWFEKAVLLYELATTCLPAQPTLPGATAQDLKHPICQWLELPGAGGLFGVFGRDKDLAQVRKKISGAAGGGTASTCSSSSRGSLAWAYNNATKTSGQQETCATNAATLQQEPRSSKSKQAKKDHTQERASASPLQQLHTGAGPSMRFFHMGIFKKDTPRSMQELVGSGLKGTDIETFFATVYRIRATFELQFYTCLHLEEFFLQEMKVSELAGAASLHREQLHIGSLVRIKDLKSVSGQALNGKYGCVEGKIAATGRWSVAVAGKKGKKALQKENLELCPRNGGGRGGHHPATGAPQTTSSLNKLRGGPPRGEELHGDEQAGKITLSMKNCIPSHCAAWTGYQTAAVFESVLLGKKEEQGSFSGQPVVVEALTWALLKLILVDGAAAAVATTANKGTTAAPCGPSIVADDSSTSSPVVKNNSNSRPLLKTSPLLIMSSGKKSLISSKTREKFIEPLQARRKSLLPLLQQRSRAVKRLRLFRNTCLLGFREIPKNSRFWDFKSITDCLVTGGVAGLKPLSEFTETHILHMPDTREREVCDLLSDLQSVRICSEKLKAELQTVVGGDFLQKFKSSELRMALLEIGKALNGGQQQCEQSKGTKNRNDNLNINASSSSTGGSSSFAPAARAVGGGEVVEEVQKNAVEDPLVFAYLDLKNDEPALTNKEMAEKLGISKEKLKRIAREAAKYFF